MCKCGSDKIVYVFSDMKIKRYMEVCENCGIHIKWVSNINWEKIKDTGITIISTSEKIKLLRKYRNLY